MMKTENRKNNEFEWYERFAFRTLTRVLHVATVTRMKPNGVWKRTNIRSRNFGPGNRSKSSSAALTD